MFRIALAVLGAVLTIVGVAALGIGVGHTLYSRNPSPSGPPADNP